eukprot:Phypoly_transcript_05697.p1 GENE.Phypoly_transcript_05697~~Phypoly_transcript_05697.p1  ORF type:complete len:578 (+),score=105.71 Phypoly_transcript_05697:142-1875(+)
MALKMYEEVGAGVDLLWGNNFNEAEEVFQKKASSSPRHALHYGEVAFFRGILSELTSDRQVAIGRFEAAIALAEDHAKALGNNMIPKGVEITPIEIPNYYLDAQIAAADGYTLLACLQVMEEARLKGFLNMRRAWKLYKEIISKAEKSGADPIVQSSVKFGAGLFYFLISMIPPGMAQRAASLAGFSGGDKELGLQYLRECHNAKSLRSILSGLVVALNHVFLTIPFEEDGAPALIAEVHAITHEGLQKYPNGSLFHTFAAVANLEKNHTEHAIKHLTTAIDNSKTIVNANPPVFMRLIVNCYAMDLDWKKAGEVLEAIIEQEKQYKSKYSWSATWNFLRLGAVYQMLGDTPKSKQCFEWTGKEKANDRWPQDLKQQAGKFLKNGGNFAMFELMYLTGHLYKVIRNTTDEKRQELIAVIDKLAAAAPGSKTPLSDAPRPASKSRFNLFAKSDPYNNPEADNRAAYLLLKGATLWTMKQNKQCEECAMEIINNSEVFANDKLYHVMAMILYARSTSQSRPNEAIANLQAAMKVTGYPWENNQKATCKRLLEKCGVNDTQVDVDKDQMDESELADEKDE